MLFKNLFNALKAIKYRVGSETILATQIMMLFVRNTSKDLSARDDLRLASACKAGTIVGKVLVVRTEECEKPVTYKWSNISYKDNGSGAAYQ